MPELEHIQEGYAYHDGKEVQLYQADDRAALEAVFFAQCIDWSIGPLSVHACVDLSLPSVSVTVQLLGVTLASCTLSLSNQSCKVGGSIDGFKAELTVTFNPSPLSITMTGTLCAPIVGCKSFDVTIPLQ